MYIYHRWEMLASCAVLSCFISNATFGCLHAVNNRGEAIVITIENMFLNALEQIRWLYGI